MAQQSARRGRKNQGFPPCFISTLRVMWFRSANSHTGPQPSSLHQRPDRWQHPTTCQILEIPLASRGASTDGKRNRRFRAPIRHDRPSSNSGLCKHFMAAGVVCREHGRLRGRHRPPHHGASRDGPSNVRYARGEPKFVMQRQLRNGPAYVPAGTPRHAMGAFELVS